MLPAPEQKRKQHQVMPQLSLFPPQKYNDLFVVLIKVWNMERLQHMYKTGFYYGLWFLSPLTSPSWR